MLFIHFPSISMMMSPSFNPLCHAGLSVFTSMMTMPGSSMRDFIEMPRYGTSGPSQRAVCGVMKFHLIKG